MSTVLTQEEIREEGGKNSIVQRGHKKVQWRLLEQGKLPFSAPCSIPCSAQDENLKTKTNGTFNDQTVLDHLNTKLVRYSDPHCN